MNRKNFTGKKPEVTHYSNADHISFHSRGVELCGKYGSLIDSPDLLTRYREAAARESDAFGRGRRSEYTEKKAEVDRQRDGAYRGICSLVRAQLKHVDSTVRAAAHRVDLLLKNYSDLSHADYSAGTAAIDNLLERLHGDEYLVDVETLGLHTWLGELEALNLRFKILAKDTARETAARPKGSAWRSRGASDDALYRIIDRIEAKVILDGTEPFAAFAREYSVLVKKYNTLVHEHYGRLHARIDIAAAVLAPLSPQPYTGTPVTLIPEVALHGTATDGTLTLTQLFFPDDFTLEFRNNRQPGTATLIIRGAGRYCGQLVTTFPITDRD
ncbi:MAG: DUF6261 family protein [Tannerella sp.]|jgi:hypothetical protein|nr:DUF6261 family protein [Tannerella sp.]